MSSNTGVYIRIRADLVGETRAELAEDLRALFASIAHGVELDGVCHFTTYDSRGNAIAVVRAIPGTNIEGRLA